jgi:hypothetical protein
MSQAKKGQNNYFPFLPTTGQNPTSHRHTSAMNNFISTQNGQSSPSHLINGDIGQNFPSMNVKIQSFFFFISFFILVR